MRQRVNEALVLIGAVLIMAFSLIDPGTSTGPTLSLLATGAHLVAYFALAAGLLVVFHDMDHGHVEAILVATTFGFLMELLQYQLPYRTFGWSDVVVNGLGASIILLDHHVDAVTWFVHTEDRLIERVLARAP